ncbi:hypothetical protein DEO72_LG10g1508 [Vigna unguiculata]|uniref:Uncharacterized protein n=1 Tax=Vigna unguiculata TaxID=3917 RepID=A0A4D6N8W7_VIGUN|nr:hypothetical protein DEO72_LG10g1508 [Vigna unguiculata]
MDKVWVGRNSMTFLVRVHGGTLSNGRNSMNLVVRVHGGASSNGRNSMNLVVRVDGGASSNGHNSMNHSVRVHGGASCKDMWELVAIAVTMGRLQLDDRGWVLGSLLSPRLKKS